MTEQERTKVLKMIEEGKITPEEGLHLMQTLEASPVEEQADPGSLVTIEHPTPVGEAKGSSFDTDPRIANIKTTVRRLWQIPLWIGIAFVVASAWGMQAIMHAVGLNFWFFFLILPLLLGVVIVAAAVGSRKARWLFVDVQQKPGDKPEHIFLGFPLPLKLAGWFLRTFGNKIPPLKNTNVDEVIEAVETGFSGDSPLIVHVDEGQGGERVKVYIG